MFEPLRSAPSLPNSFVDYVEDTWLPFVELLSKSAFNLRRVSFLLVAYIKPRVEGYVLRDFTVAVVSRLLEDAAASHTLNVETVGKFAALFRRFSLTRWERATSPGRSAADNPASCALIPESATHQRKQ